MGNSTFASSFVLFVQFVVKTARSVAARVRQG